MPALVLRSALGISFAVLRIAAAGAVPTYAVSFDDPTNAYAAYYPEITTNVLAAGTAWSNALGGYGDATLGIQVGFSPTLPTEEGASTGSHLVGYDPRSGVSVYEQGAAAKLRGAVMDTPGIDGRITIGGSFFPALAFDPGLAPSAGTDPIPVGKVDAYSVFLHEFGHILAFNGWRDGQTGALSTPYESTFDRWVVPLNGNLFFEGPHAEATYGGPVPLTWGDYGHVGNGEGRSGQDLIPDLMNGVTWLRGAHYSISLLDLAIATDAGLPVAEQPREVAEPPSLLLLGLGCLATLSLRRRSWRAVRCLA